MAILEHLDSPQKLLIFLYQKLLSNAKKKKHTHSKKKKNMVIRIMSDIRFGKWEFFGEHSLKSALMIHAGPCGGNKWEQWQGKESYTSVHSYTFTVSCSNVNTNQVTNKNKLKEKHSWNIFHSNMNKYNVIIRNTPNTIVEYFDCSALRGIFKGRMEHRVQWNRWYTIVIFPELRQNDAKCCLSQTARRDHRLLTLDRWARIQPTQAHAVLYKVASCLLATITKLNLTVVSGAYRTFKKLGTNIAF